MNRVPGIVNRGVILEGPTEKPNVLATAVFDTDGRFVEWLDPDSKVSTNLLGQPNGVATLDVDGQIDVSLFSGTIILRGRRPG